MSADASSLNPDVPIPFDACDRTGTFVFVSYAHADKAIAYPELLRIRSLGIRARRPAAPSAPAMPVTTR